jgi:hypothetical protein
MTEQQWLTETHPWYMLTFVSGRSCLRKLRLFICACCRRVMHVMNYKQLIRAVIAGEGYADGKRTEDERIQAYGAAQQIAWDHRYKEEDNSPVLYDCAFAAVRAATSDTYLSLSDAQEVVRAIVKVKHAVQETTFANEIRQLTSLVCCVFGNPFRPVNVDPAWWSSNVIGLAHAAYEDRQLPSGVFNNLRMGVLADALEEAGCDNGDILDHLRGGGEHVRGCWVIDLLLGKT